MCLASVLLFCFELQKDYNLDLLLFISDPLEECPKYALYETKHHKRVNHHVLLKTHNGET